MRLLIATLLLIALPASADWTESTFTDEMTGQSFLIITKAAEPLDFNGRTANPALELRCVHKYNQFAMRVIADVGIARDRFGGDPYSERARVQFKVGDEKPKWHVLPRIESASGSFNAVEWYSPTGLFKKMKKSDTLMVRVDSAVGGDVTFKFDLAGMDEAFQPLRERCGFKRI